MQSITSQQLVVFQKCWTKGLSWNAPRCHQGINVEEMATGFFFLFFLKTKLMHGYYYHSKILLNSSTCCDFNSYYLAISQNCLEHLCCKLHDTKEMAKLSSGKHFPLGLGTLQTTFFGTCHNADGALNLRDCLIPCTWGCWTFPNRPCIPLKVPLIYDFHQCHNC